MMSSCTSAHVWISSSALIACSTAPARGPSGSPPAARQPHQANVGRSRLPPRRAKSDIASTAWANVRARSGSSARRSAR